jgi:hypothetical protein
MPTAGMVSLMGPAVSRLLSCDMACTRVWQGMSVSTAQGGNVLVGCRVSEWCVLQPAACGGCTIALVGLCSVPCF